MLPAAATRGGAEALPAPGQGLPAPHRPPPEGPGWGGGAVPARPRPTCAALLPSPPLPRSHKAAAAAPAPLPPSLSRSFPLCPPLTRAPPPGPSPGSGPAARAQRRPRPRSRPAAARSAPAAAMSAAPRGPSAPGRGPRRRTAAAGRGRAQPARFPPPRFPPLTGPRQEPGAAQVQGEHRCARLLTSRAAPSPATFLPFCPHFLPFLPSEPLRILLASQYPAPTALLYLSLLCPLAASLCGNLTQDLRKRGRNFLPTPPGRPLDLRPEVKHRQLFKRQLFIRYTELKKKIQHNFQRIMQEIHLNVTGKCYCDCTT